MKVGLYIFLLCLICFNARGQSYIAEDNIYQESQKAYSSFGFDLDVYLSQIEQELLNQNLLVDNSAESYLRLINNLDPNSFSNTTKFDSIKLNYTTLPLVFELSYNLVLRNDSSSLVSSKFYNIIQLAKQSSQLQKTRFDLFIDAMKLELTVKDFKHPLYRLMAGMLATGTLPLAVAQGVEVKTTNSSNSTVSELSVISILINANDSLFLDAKYISFDEIYPTVRNHIVYHKANAQVLMLYSIKSSYDKYIEVFEEIKKVYTDLRNEYSLKHYKTAFSNLPEAQKELVKKLYPQMISEVEIDK